LGVVGSSLKMVKFEPTTHNTPLVAIYTEQALKRETIMLEFWLTVHRSLKRL